MLLHFYLKDPYLKKQALTKKKWAKVFKTRYHIHKRCIPTPTTNSSVNLLCVPKWEQLLLLSRKYAGDRKNEFNPYTFWFFLYQEHYFSLLYKTPMTLKNINALEVVPRSLLVYMINSVKHVRWKKYNIMHSNEIIEILFLSLWLKNLKLFMDWMRKYFERTNLKKHRKLFLLLNLLLGRFVWSYNLFLQLKGLRLVLRGKFGKAGSVRKTRKYIRRGKCSYTTKKIALINQTNLIRTLTGVFSIKFEVFF